ncbi:hypothetical protein HZB00_01405 [Candidatus Woesearchaeota archaeon]|nr:hypothetical protein [Candidatus Woesearchaeota archaeon]
MIFSLIEIVYLGITVLAVGFILSGMLHLSRDPLKLSRLFEWENIKIAMLAAAPGIILHELMHKFTAMGFGLRAMYEIWPTGLLIGAILRIVNAGFMLLAPGYVVFSGASPIQTTLIALAGPLTNGMLWGIAYVALRRKDLSIRAILILTATKEINKWLFIFNVIPIPPLDGFKAIQPWM